MVDRGLSVISLKPSLMPITSHPWTAIADLTTARNDSNRDSHHPLSGRNALDLPACDCSPGDSVSCDDAFVRSRRFSAVPSTALKRLRTGVRENLAGPLQWIDRDTVGAFPGAGDCRC